MIEILDIGCQGSSGETLPHPESMHKSSGAGSGQRVFNIEKVETNRYRSHVRVQNISLACIWTARSGLPVALPVPLPIQHQRRSFNSVPAITSLPSDQRHWTTESRCRGFTAHPSLDLRLKTSPRGSATSRWQMLQAPYQVTFLVFLPSILLGNWTCRLPPSLNHANPSVFPNPCAPQAEPISTDPRPPSWPSLPFTEILPITRKTSI